MRKRISIPALMAELNLSQAQVYRLLADGMPRDLQGALAWRERNRGYKPTKRQEAAKRATAKAECDWWLKTLYG